MTRYPSRNKHTEEVYEDGELVEVIEWDEGGTVIREKRRTPSKLKDYYSP